VDQWTSFSEPGRFPLVLKPVVAGSRINKVLIDGGSGLNVLFTKTLKKMKLDITHTHKEHIAFQWYRPRERG
jgi:hypothetical protein